MTVCWSCSYPSKGIKRVTPTDPTGVCRNCYSLTCDWHGAVDTSKGQFWCAVCLEALVIRRTGIGGPGGSGPGGGPGGRPSESDGEDGDQSLLGGPIASLISLQLRFPEIVAASRDHAEPIRPVAYLVEMLAELRWRRLANERLTVPHDLVAPLVGISLWAAGHEAGDVPDYAPGEEGPLLRRNPLVAGLLYARRLESTREVFETNVGEPPYLDKKQLWPSGLDEELHRELGDEVERLTHMEAPRRVFYEYEQGSGDGESGHAGG